MRARLRNSRRRARAQNHGPFPGPFAVTAVADAKAKEWKQKVESGLGAKVRVIVAEPPYSVEEDVDGKGFWFRPRHYKADERRKQLRKQLFASLVTMLGYVTRHRPDMIVGCEQGGTVAALSTLPLVLEAACRARVLTSPEVKAIRQAWAGMKAVYIVNPIVLPQRTLYAELLEAVPEIALLQPRGVLRCVVQSNTSHLKAEFGQALAEAVGSLSQGRRFGPDLGRDHSPSRHPAAHLHRGRRQRPRGVRGVWEARRSWALPKMRPSHALHLHIPRSSWPPAVVPKML